MANPTAVYQAIGFKDGTKYVQQIPIGNAQMTLEDAKKLALACIGHYKSLKVVETKVVDNTMTREVVWELEDASSAPMVGTV